ncbi:hypothetical protein [Serratia fonticola]|uniref:hypothetical protein n=1 Tax=Serratia fonticola TaxID=47917 RepID=UPI0034C69A67
MNNLDILLSGKCLLKEINSLKDDCRTWVEISLQDNLKPIYPFRTEPYAMVGKSSYANKCDKDEAKFKIRVSSFLSSDIENEYDPSYDFVGKYENIDSLEELDTYLDSIGLKLDDFIDSSRDDEYPL